MNLSPGTVTEILEGIEDDGLSGSEVTGIVGGVAEGAITGMILVFMVSAFVKATNMPKKYATEVLDLAREI